MKFTPVRTWIMPRHKAGRMFRMPMGDGRFRIYWYDERGCLHSQARAEKKARALAEGE